MRPAIVIPWAFVKQCNHRLMPVVRAGRARLITAPDYRLAKQGAEYHVKAQWKGSPMTVPVELHARVWFPSNRRADLGNLGKLLGDAMSGLVYADDSQIHKETYERMGVDRENPRVEITISALDADFTEPRPEKRLKPSPGIEPIAILPGQGADGKVPKRRTAP